MRHFALRAASPSLAAVAAMTVSLRSCYTTRERRHDGGGGGGAGSAGSAAAPARGRGPVKDRLPPVSTDLADPRRRLAVLIDGTNPHLVPGDCTTAEQAFRTAALFTTVLPAVLQVGVPVLLRVFAHQLPPTWAPLMAGSAADGAARSSTDQPLTLLPLQTPSSSSSSSPQVQLEFFRVERFIPVAMQIEADARHLYEFRATNKVEGVCYVCNEVDRATFTSLMQEQRSGSAALAGLLREINPAAAAASASAAAAPSVSAAFFNQYVVDELGIVAEQLADGRSRDGS
ncbi:hypothetical protein NESM_000625000 [Novymonas esmeraldas]|uniref:Uncharacterized protein n=1 Tax=Novymonas esmeraldas TaxID=1808958 RepID=A0AAW0ESV7_9TRYP